MIEMFKLIKGIYDPHISFNIGLQVKKECNTRGHPLKLEKKRSNKQIRSKSFTQRSVNLWNRLPHNVVLADSLNSFKNRLDNHWSHQDLVTNYKAQIKP